MKIWVSDWTQTCISLTAPNHSSWNPNFHLDYWLSPSSEGSWASFLDDIWCVTSENSTKFIGSTSCTSLKSAESSLRILACVQLIFGMFHFTFLRIRLKVKVFILIKIKCFTKFEKCFDKAVKFEEHFYKDKKITFNVF